jgi:TonB family protein
MTRLFCSLFLLVTALDASRLVSLAAEAQVDVSPCSDSTRRISSGELTSLLQFRTPVLTPLMEHLSLHGRVTLRVCVSKKGKVLSASVIDGHPMARQAVLDSVQNWTFKPYRVNQQPEPVIADLEVDYDFRSPPQTTAQMQLGSKVAETLLIHKEEPACQKDADGVKVTGTVVIDITIDKNGNVTRPHTLSGPKMLRPLAIATVRKYRYKPYSLNKTQVEVETVVSISIDCFFHTGQA